MPDWQQIEIDYRAGIKTVRQIASEHGITHGAVNKRRLRDGWDRGEVSTHPVSKPVSKKKPKKAVSKPKAVSKDKPKRKYKKRERLPAVPLTGPGGCPPDYRPEFCEIAHKFCLLGATNERLAEFFNVAVATIYNWQNQYPEFLEALRSGREVADAEIARSLYHRAKGYSHQETKAQLVSDSEGNSRWETLDMIKHHPPDTKAAIHWLGVRQGEKWREKQDLNHNVGGTVIHVHTAVPKPQPLPEAFQKPKLLKGGNGNGDG